MSMNDILIMILGVSLILGFMVLAVFIWGAKDGQFDDTKKMMDGVLFDSEDDLNDAIIKEKKKIK
jgi:cbb3-type cytochrome oxidase maturation protein